MKPFERILVAIDGSELAARALRQAVQLAGGCGSQLVILNIAPRYTLAPFEGAVAFAPEEIARAEGLASHASDLVLEASRQEALAAGLRTHTVVVHSDDVAASIVAAAKKHDCDLIVMASHMRSGLRKWLLGSETARVLELARIAVLVLR